MMCRTPNKTTSEAERAMPATHSKNIEYHEFIGPRKRMSAQKSTAVRSDVELGANNTTVLAQSTGAHLSASQQVAQSHESKCK